MNISGRVTTMDSHAGVACLVATCKKNVVNLFDYIHRTLRAIPQDNPRNQIEQLMPWTYDQASSLDA